MAFGQWGDLMIYGFADDLGHVFRWVALDLRRFRGAAMRALHDQNVAYRTRADPPPPLTRGPVGNSDGVKFLYVDTRDDRVRQCIAKHSTGYFDEAA